MIVIGIDVSKDSNKVCAKERREDGGSRILRTKTFPNSGIGHEDLYEWMKGHKMAEALVVMEATGVYHEDLLWYLYDCGARCAVVQPGRINAFSRTLDHKAKTDRLDASLIAEYGLAMYGQLKPWEPASESIRDIRALSRALERANQAAGVLKNHRHALMHSHRSSETAKFILEKSEKVLQTLEEEIDELEKAIEEVVRGDEKVSKTTEALSAIHGMTSFTAARVLAETNCFENFSGSRKLVSYAGLDVKVYQSGTIDRRSGISKRGNAHLRGMLFMNAMTVMMREKPFKEFRERLLGRGVNRKVIVVAVMRKLLVLMFAIVKHGTVFDPDYDWHKAHGVPRKGEA